MKKGIRMGALAIKQQLANGWQELGEMQGMKKMQDAEFKMQDARC